MKKDGREVSSNFGALIKSHRKSQNLSLKELSELSGVSESYLSRLEISKKRAPSYKVTESICSALKISLDELFNVTGSSCDGGTKSIGSLIITNEFTISGKKATRKQKEAIIELLEFITQPETNFNSINRKTLEDISKTIILANQAKMNL